MCKWKPNNVHILRLNNNAKQFFTIIYIINDAKKWINNRRLYNNNNNHKPRQPKHLSITNTQFKVATNPIPIQGFYKPNTNTRETNLPITLCQTTNTHIPISILLSFIAIIAFSLKLCDFLLPGRIHGLLAFVSPGNSSLSPILHSFLTSFFLLFRSVAVAHVFMFLNCGFLAYLCSSLLSYIADLAFSTYFSRTFGSFMFILTQSSDHMAFCPLFVALYCLDKGP